MANVLWMDSWDHYATANLTTKANAIFGYTSPYTAPVITTAAGRSGYGLLLKGGGHYYGSFADTQNVVVGFSFRPTAIVAKRIVALRDEDTVQLYLNLTSAGKITVVRGDGTTLGTSSKSLEGNKFYYVEIQATISNTAGSYNLYINGTSEVSDSPLDTQISSNARVNLLGLGHESNELTAFHYDDLYVTDGTVLGPTSIDVLKPNGGVPGFMNMVIVGGAGSAYQAISDITPDGDTSYLYNPSGRGTNVHFSEFENIRDTTGGAIFAAAVRTYARKEYGNTRGFFTGMYPGTADGAPGSLQYYSGAHYMEIEYAYHSDIYNTNPGTGGTWTVASINALKAGWKTVIG